MKLKKKILPILIGAVGLIGCSTLLASCVKKEPTHPFTTPIDIKDGQHLTSSLATKDAWTKMMQTSSGLQTYLTATLKTQLYQWVANNKNVKWNRSVKQFIENKTSELERIKKTAKERFGSQEKIAIQNAIFNSFGGTRDNWLQYQAIDFAYDLINESIFDDKDLLFVKNDKNEYVNVKTNDAAPFLNKNNPVEFFSNDLDVKGYAHFLNFVLDAFIKQDVPMTFDKIEFTYDDIKRQNVYNKQVFKHLPEKTSQSFPFFDDEDVYNTTLKKYQNFIKTVKDGTWKTDEETKKNIKSHTVTLTDLVNKKGMQTNEVFSILSIINRLGGHDSQQDIPLVDGFKPTLLDNFINKTSTKIPGFNDFFYPLTLNNQPAFQKELENAQQITNQLIVRENNELYALNLTATGVVIYHLDNFETLKSQAQNQANFYQTLKTRFLQQTALFDNKKDIANTNAINGMALLKTFFKAHKEQLLIDYYAQKFDDHDFLFKTNLVADDQNQVTLKPFDSDLKQLIDLWFKYNQADNNDKLFYAINNQVNAYNHEHQSSLLADSIFDHGLSVGLPLTLNDQHHYQIIEDLLNTYHLHETADSQVIFELINKVAQKVIFDQQLINPNVSKTQHITFNDYVVNSVFTNGYNSGNLTNLILREQYAQLLKDIIDLNTLSYLPTQDQALINDAINMFIKQKKELISAQNTYAADDHLQLSLYVQAYDNALQKNVLNDKIQSLLLNYNLNALDIKNIYTFICLLGIKEQKITLDPFKDYLNTQLKQNDNQLFIAYSANDDIKKIPNFGTNLLDDYTSHTYQINHPLFNTLNIKTQDVYDIVENKIVNKPAFLAQQTFNVSNHTVNYTTDNNGHVIHGFLGLVNKQNQHTVLAPEFMSVDLYNNQTFTLVEDAKLKYKGVLYKYGSKEALITLINSFDTYNQFYSLASELKPLLYSTKTNDLLVSIIKQTKEFIDSNNQKQSLNLTFDELRTRLTNVINEYSDLLFTPMQLDYIYYQDDTKVSNLFKNKDHPDQRYNLVVSQINYQDIQTLDFTQDAPEKLMHLSKDQIIKTALLAVLNDPVISIQVFSQIPDDYKFEIFDQRLGTPDLKPFIKK
ncbi:hypothetical protein OF375_02460 [Ureaplasma miroungigenitalium]|uniref:DUF3713 domain-containing protein n=1 Tax=Ureaplasma miroungigenitalium TaxID=1042321 RepID=UPI0021E87852|nr:DUF3713 domain-containing protein [Ureaplasma miroungigenitalium]MCV3734427.1 hypothetical protein [Ureaplasma miroungigenitalium]